jgi:hypothetical protein
VKILALSHQNLIRASPAQHPALGAAGGASRLETDVTAPSRALFVYVGGVYFAVMNAMTTIRVEASVRDRLAALAEAHGRSLGAELAAILDDLEWGAIEAGYRRLAANPDDLAAYLAEAEAFSRLDLQDLADTAAEEYPEYNGGVA